MSEMKKLGAQVVVDALVAHDVKTFFMNPGTSEVHLVSAIDQHPEAKPVLCLFEGGATGAADGYARATGQPAAVLLHLGPGLANGLANLHNARKARSPMVVVVGEHARRHLAFDTPLNSDLSSLARYAAKQVFELHLDSDIDDIVTAAVSAAKTEPTGPVVIVANVDVMWSEARAASSTSTPVTSSYREDAEQPSLQAIADALRKGSGTALVLGGKALCAEGIELADQIAQTTGCKLFCETFNAVHERGASVPQVERIPYFPEHAAPRLADFSRFVLLGSRPPVAFFASPEGRSELTPEGAEILQFGAEVPVLSNLRALATTLDATAKARRQERVLHDTPAGKLNAKAIWSAMNRRLPRGAIVSDESGVTSIGSDEAMSGAERHMWMNLTGGSIGQAIPLATGAAVGRPDTTVVAMQGDGGAMYTIQSLWTQAREGLRVVNVILRNDRYAILDYEVKRHGIAPLTSKGARMFDLTEPAIDWAALARSLGVTVFVAASAEEFESCLDQALRVQGPTLIAARLASSNRS